MDNFKEGTPIQEFFAERSVLITGGTGFFGKVLIDKLLRSCPKIGSLFLLVRTKKGKNMEERLEELLKDVVFDRLRNEVPEFRQKVIGISGDCALPGLGISAEDRENITRNVSIVFHGAATVRFDENLKIAVAINVSGTNEIINLCRDISGLKALVHVSTAYSNCPLKEIDEKFYEPTITGDNLMKLAECGDKEFLGNITTQVIGKWPNTYTFTKQVAEDVVANHGKGLPIAMLRPSIVISTYKEPVPGWVDNVYGPMGANAAAGAGLLRVMYMAPELNANLVPVDYCVNALIATAWDIAKNHYRYDEPPVYNFASCRNPFTWGEYTDYTLKYAHKTPVVSSIWYYSMARTKCIYMYYILHFLLHLVPAVIIDIGLKISGRKPMLIKAYKKIMKFTGVLSYFSSQEWKLSDPNVQRLWRSLSAKDQNLFQFNVETINWDSYFKTYVIGNRLYLFKEDLTTAHRAKLRQQM